MRLVNLAFAHPYLVILVFRIILVLTCAIHCRRRKSAYRASSDTRSHRYRQTPPSVRATSLMPTMKA
jgi:hypothetical protein